MAARVEPRFIAPAAHVSDSFTALHVSSEGLNPSLPQGSETRLRGKANSGGVALGVEARRPGSKPKSRPGAPSTLPVLSPDDPWESLFHTLLAVPF